MGVSLTEGGGGAEKWMGTRGREEEGRGEWEGKLEIRSTKHEINFKAGNSKKEGTRLSGDGGGSQKVLRQLPGIKRFSDAP
jgi:hypothetical protein